MLQRIALILGLSLFGIVILIIILGAVIGSEEDTPAAISTELPRPTSVIPTVQRISTPIPTPVNVDSQSAPPTPTSAPSSIPFSIPGDEFVNMTAEEFEAALRAHGTFDEEYIDKALRNFESDKAAGVRWQAQFKVHWPNVDAFHASMSAISEDRIIDKSESQHICFALDQWVDQMTAARDYVQNYREVDPETVENSGLPNLESEAERALALLNQTECQ